MPKIGVHGSRDPVLEVALGDDPALAQGGDHRGLLRWRWWSVRCRKTSSRVGPAQQHVVDLEPGGVERADRGEQGGGAAGWAGLDGHLARCPRVGGAAEHARRARPGRCRRAAVTITRSPPSRLFSSRGRALGDHPAGAHHRDPVGELVGLVEVLRGEQHRRAELDDPRGRSPRPRCGRAGRARWSARRGTAGWAGGSGWRRCRAGGACRRSTSRPCGRRRPRARRSSAARRRARRRRGLGQPVQAAEHDQVLAAEQHLVERGGLADQADRAGAPRRRRGGRRGRRPATSPSSQRVRVAKVWTAVVLPAPLGPSRAWMVPGATSRSNPSRAWVSP